MSTPRTKRLRILHVGNVANNAFHAADILNAAGHDCDVLCHDYYHVMGSPEWEDADFVGQVGNAFFPDWDAVDLQGYQRPKWFAQSTLDVCVAYLRARRKGDAATVSRLWERMAEEPRVPTREPEESLEQVLRSTARSWPGIDLRQLAGDLSITFFPPYYQPMIRELRNLFAEYEVVVGYGAYPIFPFIAGASTYLAFEHGTIRQIPFDDNALGRLTALGYRGADGTVITNADNRVAAERLGLERYRFVPHPVNERWAQAGIGDELRARLKEELQAEFLVFHPARQHWNAARDPSMEKGNDVFIKGLAQVATEVSRGIGAVFVDWGESVEASKTLLADLGIADRVKWIDLQHNCNMSRYIDACDLVADQFYLGSFGNIMPRALAQGTPSMLYLDEEAHRWCYPKLPPVVNAATPEAVCAGLRRAVADRDYLLTLSEAGRAWYSAYHSRDFICRELESFFNDVLEGRPPPGDRPQTTAGVSLPGRSVARSGRRMLKRLLRPVLKPMVDAVNAPVRRELARVQAEALRRSERQAGRVGLQVEQLKEGVGRQVKGLEDGLKVLAATVDLDGARLKGAWEGIEEHGTLLKELRKTVADELKEGVGRQVKSVEDGVMELAARVDLNGVRLKGAWEGIEEHGALLTELRKTVADQRRGSLEAQRQIEDVRRAEAALHQGLALVLERAEEVRMSAVATEAAIVAVRADFAAVRSDAAQRERSLIALQEEKQGQIRIGKTAFTELKQDLRVAQANISALGDRLLATDAAIRAVGVDLGDARDEIARSRTVTAQMAELKEEFRADRGSAEAAVESIRTDLLAVQNQYSRVGSGPGPAPGTQTSAGGTLTDEATGANLAEEFRWVRETTAALQQALSTLEPELAKQGVSSLAGQLGQQRDRLDEVCRSLEIFQTAFGSLEAPLLQLQSSVANLEASRALAERATKERERELKQMLLRSRRLLALTRRAPKVRVAPPRTLRTGASYLALLEKDFPEAYKVWFPLLASNERAYKEDLRGNCSIAGHAVATSFGDFIVPYLKGQLLDIGCGPQAVPEYLRGYPLSQVSGIDPLEPQEPHPFQFVRGIAEYLPWRASSFDTVVVATSLDHVLSVERTLREILRVLKRGGLLLIWAGFIRGSARYDERSPAPEPVDEFHLFHFDRETFESTLGRVFDIVESFDFDGQSNFFALRPRDSSS